MRGREQNVSVHCGDGIRNRRASARAAAAALAAVAAVACGSGNGGGVPGESGTTSSQPAPTREHVGALPAPGMAWVIFGADTVAAEVAGIPAERQKGLMDRDAVPDGTGMLFVFPRSEERSFWMKDTYVSLDIAFFDDGNRVVSIKQMEALDESLTDSDAATSLVLEVRKGWFAERGIGVGATATVVFGPGLTVR